MKDLKECAFKIADEDLKDIVDMIETSVCCDNCKIKEFCNVNCSKNNENNNICKSSWKQYIEQFIINEKIDYKAIDELADKIALSMNNCLNCEIKQFCNKNTEYTTCSSTWSLWLLTKIVF